MSDEYSGDILSGLSPDMKKEILKALVASLAGGLTDSDRRDVLQTALTGHARGRELIDMVGQ